MGSDTIDFSILPNASPIIEARRGMRRERMGATGFATPSLTFCAAPKDRSKARNVTDGITNPVRHCASWTRRRGPEARRGMWNMRDGVLAGSQAPASKPLT